MSKTKSNDKIPRDEMHLAIAIATAKAHGLKWTSDADFRDGGGKRTDMHDPNLKYCCAAGALQLAGLDWGDEVIEGNDADAIDGWSDGTDDRGESLGWAFRKAMT